MIIVLTGFFVLIAALRLHYGLVIIAALLPAYLLRLSILGVPLTFLEMMILTVTAVWLITVIRRRQWRRVRFPLFWPVMLFVASATIAMFVAPDLRVAAGLWKALIIEPILVFIVLVNTVTTSRQRAAIVWALGFSAVAVGLMAAAQYLGWAASPEPWISEAPKRVTSFFEYPNAVGLFLTPLIALFATFLTWKNHRWLPWLSGVIVVIGSFTLFAAFTRGAALGLAAAALFLACASQRKRLVWMIILFSLVATLVWPTARQNLQSIVTVQDTSTDVRVVLWQGTWDLLKAHPWLGAGLGGFPELYDQYRQAKHTELPLYPHNIFFNFWVELGLLGLLAMIIIMFRAFWRGRHNIVNKSSPALSLGLMAALIAMVIYGLVDVPYFKNDLAAQFWILLGLLYCISDKKS